MTGSPRRIVFIEGNRDGTVGGSFQCLYDIARHLDRSRYEPVAVFWDGNRFADRLRAEGVEVHLWRDLHPRDGNPTARRSVVAKAVVAARAVATRRRFLRSIHASLVHLNNSPEIGHDDWLPAARLLGIPIVAHARGEIAGERRRVRRRLLAGYDRVIAISRHIAESLVQAGVPEGRITQIYDGIDIPSIQAAATRPPAAVRRALGVPEGAFLILMVGNLKPWKGQRVLLDALDRLPPERARCSYAAFAGAAPPEAQGYEADLLARVAREGLAERVRFLGPRSDVPDLIAAADVVVHASTKPEPFGLVVVEGMALGKPVIASRLGGPAETVAPGTGLLFDPAKPEELAGLLGRLLDDESLRRALGERAQARAEEFSIERNVTAIQSVYDALLSPPRRRTAPA